MKRGVKWWDEWFLGMAAYVATASKDPSTHVGCVLARPNKSIASVGFNGFPKGVEDRPEWLNNREEKLKRMVHGELNAILNAHEPVDGYTLYNWPGRSCSRCAVHVIQAGIVRVVSAYDANSPFEQRWKEDMDLGESLFGEAGIEVVNFECTTDPSEFRTHKMIDGRGNEVEVMTL